MLYYHISTNYSWNVFTVVCPLLQITTKMLTLYAETFEIVHSGICKGTKIVRTLYQMMFLLYHQRRESQSKCKLSFYTSKQVLCQLSKENILLC